MRTIKTNITNYLNRYAAFRDRSFSFQLTLIVLLTVIFSFAIGRFYTMAQAKSELVGSAASGITAGIGVLTK